MNILFTGLYPMWHCHYVAELNYIEKHLSLGDRVTLLRCDADQLSCEANPKRELAHCLRCIGIRQHGESLLSSKVKTAPLIIEDFKNAVPTKFEVNVSTISEMKETHVAGFDIGSAVYSSLVDRTMSATPDLNIHRDLARDLFLDSYRIYLSAIRYLEEGRYDRVYVFNGRYAGARPWIRACEKKKVSFFTHDKFSSPDRPTRFDCALPHIPAQYPRRILDFWESAEGNSAIVDQARDFFEERPKGKLTGWVSFVDLQEKDMLPAGWDSSKKNIAIFSSTEWEFVSIKELMENALFPCQEDACHYLITEVHKRDPEVCFYIRIHPNSSADKGRWWELPSIQNLAHCTIIPPESSISSYALLQACDTSVTYISTIGVEATYWGKPSIILAQAIYWGLDAVYEPKTREEALEMLCSDLVPKPQTNALKYAAFLRCGGDELPHSEAVNYYTMTFKGQILEARQEVHAWLGACEKRSPASGWKKWLRDKRDRRHLKTLWKECDGWFAAESSGKESTAGR